MQRWFGGGGASKDDSTGGVSRALSESSARPESTHEQQLALISELQDALRRADAGTRAEKAARQEAEAIAAAKLAELEADARASREYQAQAQQRCAELENKLQGALTGSGGVSDATNRQIQVAVDKALIKAQEEHQEVMAKVLTAKRAMTQQVEALESRLQRQHTEAQARSAQQQTVISSLEAAKGQLEASLRRSRQDLVARDALVR